MHYLMDGLEYERTCRYLKFESASVWVFLSIGDFACITMCTFLGPWLSFVIIHLFMCIECFKPDFFLAWSHIPNVLRLQLSLIVWFVCVLN